MATQLLRRDFLAKSAVLGAGACPAMLALSLLPGAPAHAFALQAGHGQGKHVVVLGGGLAGMTAAYELGKLGYRCTILEARERSGGRCWSIRGAAPPNPRTPGTRLGSIRGCISTRRPRAFRTTTSLPCTTAGSWARAAGGVQQRERGQLLLCRKQGAPVE